jgi:hypothetical protein
MARHVDTVVNQFLYKHEHNVPSFAGSISEMVVCGLEVLWQLGTSVPPAAVCSTLTAVTMLVKFPHHNLFYFTPCWTYQKATQENSGFQSRPHDPCWDIPLPSSCTTMP